MLKADTTSRIEKIEILSLKIDSILLESEIQAFNPNKKIYITLKDKRKIPIIQTQDFEETKNIEEEASKLAYFLKVPLKTR